MRDEEAFDAFYRSTRESLLRQTYLVSGDGETAARAVREAYVEAWRRWRGLRRAEHPLVGLRRVAWRVAERSPRRARPSSTGAERDPLIEALQRLPARERRLLVLVDVAGLSVADAAAEVGLPQALAAGALTAARDTVTAASPADAGGELPQRLAETGGEADPGLLPSTRVVLREGRARRRRPIALTAVAALAVALAGTATVGLLRDGVSQPGRPGTDTSAPAPGSTAPSPTRSAADLLLDERGVTPLGPGRRWRVVRTDGNTRGDGLNYICQQRRFADPTGTGSLVRTFRTVNGRGTAVESLEVSRDPQRARRAFERVVGWFAGCDEARLQLLATYRVRGVGDEATVLLLRSWRQPAAVYAVGVARAGTMTTVTVGRTPPGVAPQPAQIVRVVARATRPLCPPSVSGCAAFPRWRPASPPPAGSARGMLAVIDLPPVGDVRQPWVAVEAAPARRNNPAATTCDRADFGAAPARGARTRTYLIPQARLPVRFGLSQTYALFPGPGAAERFLGALRTRTATCEDRDRATTVRVQTALRRAPAGGSLSSYELTTEVSESRAVRFRVGFVRRGSAAAQVTFAPGDDDDMTDAAFDALLVRAGERLGELR